MHLLLKRYSLHLFLAIALSIVLLSSTQAAPTNCHQITSANNIFPQSSYSPPFNVLSASSELLLSAVCDGNAVTLQAGLESDNVYVYNQGYIQAGNTWQPFTYPGAVTSGHWIPRRATNTIPSASQGVNHFASYVCLWDGNAWKCGCSDAACTASRWQIQQYTVGIAVTPTPQPTTSAPAEAPNRQLFTLINRHRQTLGKTPFIWNTEIENVIAAHVQNMETGTVPFGHSGSSARYNQIYSAVSGSRGCGEVVATKKSGETPEAALQTWLNSPPHRAILESDRQIAGFAIVGKFAGGIACSLTAQ